MLIQLIEHGEVMLVITPSIHHSILATLLQQGTLYASKVKGTQLKLQIL